MQFIDNYYYDYIVLNSKTIDFNLFSKDPDDDVLVDNNLNLRYDFGCCDHFVCPRDNLNEIKTTNKTIFLVCVECNFSANISHTNVKVIHSIC